MAAAHDARTGAGTEWILGVELGTVNIAAAICWGPSSTAPVLTARTCGARTCRPPNFPRINVNFVLR